MTSTPSRKCWRCRQSATREIAQIRAMEASWRERVARADREDRGATLAMSMLLQCADRLAALLKKPTDG